jgi:hypothetical protein
MMNLFLSIATFGAFALLWGAWRLWQREGFSQKMLLMLVAAIVIFGNIAIWIVPNDQGRSLVTTTSQ